MDPMGAMNAAGAMGTVDAVDVVGSVGAGAQWMQWAQWVQWAQWTPWTQWTQWVQWTRWALQPPMAATISISNVRVHGHPIIVAAVSQENGMRISRTARKEGKATKCKCANHIPSIIYSTQMCKCAKRTENEQMARTAAQKALHICRRSGMFQSGNRDISIFRW